MKDRGCIQASRKRPINYPEDTKNLEKTPKRSRKDHEKLRKFRRLDRAETNVRRKFPGLIFN